MINYLCFTNKIIKQNYPLRLHSEQQKEFEINKIEEQGGVWGPIECSNSMDTLGKECELKDKYRYSYKEKALKNVTPPKIPPLGYIDDLLSISKCGTDATDVNVFLTTKTELKRLNLNVGNENKKSKCQTVQIGKKGKNEICPELSANGKLLDQVDEITYLGDLIHSSGKKLSH